MSSMPDPLVKSKNFLALVENHERAGEEGFCDTVCLEGSTRSTKTWSILEYLINLLMQHALVATCFRHDSTTHDRAAVRDFKEIMAERYPAEWQRGKRFNKQSKTFTFSSGGVLEFAGANDKQKLHGPARDIAWLNEAMEIRLDAYRQIAVRTRLLTILDWNPSLSHHWVFEQVLGQPNVRYVHSTYKDNPYLTGKQVAEIEKREPTPANLAAGTADPYWWDVYGLGKRGRREGAIFMNWQVTDEWPQRQLCYRHGYGLDYGFSADPTALVECAVYNDALYLREIVYETELVAQHNPLYPDVPSIEGRFTERGVEKLARIHAENARPEINRALSLSGYRIVPTKKSPDSVHNGIQLLKGIPLYVHRGSHNLQMELENYVWKKTPDGVVTDEPEDEFNHAIDAVRYWALKELKPRPRNLEESGQAQVFETNRRNWR
ncbi:MAG: phage terminase large subunit [Verrucomicrobiota bacterium JB024]|nr:phage terminase large subunit [Verrucomicrobiota bacterium JB024]